jgi:hypothetical protein
MTVYHIIIERISTGERGPLGITRQDDEMAARAYAEAAVAAQPDADDYRVIEVRARSEG